MTTASLLLALGVALTSVALAPTASAVCSFGGDPHTAWYRVGCESSDQSGQCGNGYPDPYALVQNANDCPTAAYYFVGLTVDNQPILPLP